MRITKRETLGGIAALTAVGVGWTQRVVSGALGAEGDSGTRNDIIVFGDSISEMEFNAGGNAATRRSGLQINSPGTSEIATALALLGWPLRFDVFNDPGGLTPGLLTNLPKYYLGADYAQGGAQIADISAQIDRARLAGETPLFIILNVGTNSLPLTEAKQTAHFTLIGAIKRNWPKAQIGVCNIRPSTLTAAAIGNRSMLNIDAANRMLAANVEASGSEVALLDVCLAYRSRGDGRYALASDLSNDGLHPSIQGSSCAGAPVVKAWLASTLAARAGDIPQRGMSSLLPANLSRLSGEAVPIDIMGSGGNAGHVTGAVPAGWAVYKSGSVGSDVRCTPLPGGGVRVAVTCAPGNPIETIGFRPSGINFFASTLLAGQWFQMLAMITDDRFPGLKQATMIWRERSDPANNVGAFTVGLGADGGSGPRTHKLVLPPKKGVPTSNGAQGGITLSFDPNVRGTFNFDVTFCDIHLRAAPNGAS
jgi:hypothetical protein